MLCAMGLFVACKGGVSPAESDMATANEAADTISESIDTVSQYRVTEDVYVNGNQTEYVMIFCSKGCIERMLHDVENDSAELDNFYVAMDDLGYYYHLCHERLESMGVKYHETSADKTVFCPGGMSFHPQDSCDYGVLIVKPGCQFEFVDLMDFLFGQE